MFVKLCWFGFFLLIIIVVHDYNAVGITVESRNLAFKEGNRQAKSNDLSTIFIRALFLFEKKYRAGPCFSCDCLLVGFRRLKTLFLYDNIRQNAVSVEKTVVWIM